MIRTYRQQQLQVVVADDTEEMARQAAADFAAEAARLLRVRDAINVVFAGAQSQMAFHAALAARTDIDWSRINALAVDEFYAPHIPRELSVCDQPRRDLYSKVPLRSVNVLDFAAADAEAERARYEAVVAAHPLDIACLGIGVSGHVAFNEPGADFADPQKVRIIDVCDESKRQLTSDPNFAALGAIPDRGITMTIPTLMSAAVVLVVVPYQIKADVVRRVLLSPLTSQLPATILKQKSGARLYLDGESCSASGELFTQ